MISTRVHGIVDHATALALAVAPRLLGWDKSVTRGLDVAAGGILANSLATDYEFGAMPVMTMRQHLMMDILAGAAFMTAGAVLTNQRPEVRTALAGVGAMEIALALMTDQESGQGRPLIDALDRSADQTDQVEAHPS